MFFDILRNEYETSSFTKEEFNILNNSIKNNEKLKLYVDNAFTRIHNIVAEWNGHGLQIPPHLIENYILRHILNGLNDNSLPSDVVLDGETREYIHPNNKKRIDAYGKYSMDRTDVGYIISYEELDKRKTKHLEVDNLSIRFERDKFNYVIDTEFTELLPEEQNREIILANELSAIKEKNARLEANISGLNDLLKLSETEKSKLKSTINDLDNIISSLNDEMTNQANTFKAQIEKLADNSIEDLLKNIKSEIDKNKDEISNLEDKLQEERARKAEEERAKQNEEKSTRTSDKELTELKNEEDVGKDIKEEEERLKEVGIQNPKDLNLTKEVVKLPNKFSGYSDKSVSYILKQTGIDFDTKQELLAEKSKQDINKNKLANLIREYNSLQEDRNVIIQNEKLEFSEKLSDLTEIGTDVKKVISEIEKLIG
jgi:hypothetical protein